MLLFDIGANRGDATWVGLNKGYKVIALEPAPRIYKELVKNFVYSNNVVPLRYAVSDKDNDRLKFYECVEDGLSTLNKEWLTSDSMPYSGKEFREIEVNTITIDTLAEIYGKPDLIKIDVEGAEWSVFNGMTKYYGQLCFEWTFETMVEHEKQLDYLYTLGYRTVAPQYIVGHLQEPEVSFELKEDNKHQLIIWHQETSDAWIEGGWQISNLRPTADVGMIWVK
jgi:FkbM family methyltransferase